MSGYVNSPEQQVRVSAGTAFKIGFFGALGAFCLSLLASILLGIISLILATVFGLGLFEILNG